MPITSTIQQGTLSFAAATPGNSAIGDAAAAGTSGSVARADHVHGREAAGTPGASAVGDTAAAGSATTVARSDHRHSREAFGTPVNLDASVTSLSAGSLTTVARADHIHTLSNLLVLIGSVTVSSATASYTLTNLPQTYKGLFIYAATTGVNTPNHTSAVSAQFNGDTGSNYYSGNTAAFRTDAYLGLSSLTGNYVNANAFFFCFISDYASTIDKKMTYGISTYNGLTSTNALNTAAYYNYWNSTSAITSIKLFITDGYNFEVGSHIRVYGMP